MAIKREETHSTGSSDNNSNFHESSFFSLPTEMIFYLSSFFDKQSLGRASNTGHKLYGLFKASLSTLARAEQLLKLVMDGNPEGIKELLTLHSDGEIVLKKVAGTEECGRSWNSVSPLEFAAWAGDTALVNLLLNAVPNNKKANALEQLKNVMEKGTEHGKHLAAYYLLIESSEQYTAKFSKWNWNKRDDYRILELGKKQFMLPLVGLQQMCDMEEYFYFSKFDRPPQRSVKLKGSSSLLPLASSGLGVKFSLLIGGVGTPGPGAGRAGFGICVTLPTMNLNIAAWRCFCEVKTRDLVNIIEQQQIPSAETESSASMG